MKALSARQAASCEAAKTKRCQCRCGGEFHGTKRAVEGLRQGDPHALKDAEPAYVEDIVGVVLADAEEEQLRWEVISRAAMDQAALDVAGQR